MLLSKLSGSVFQHFYYLTAQSRIIPSFWKAVNSDCLISAYASFFSASSIALPMSFLIYLLSNSIHVVAE